MKKTTYTTLFSLLFTTAITPVYAMERQEEESEKKSSFLSYRHSKRAVGDEFILNQNTTGSQRDPSVASLTNGNVFIVWTDYQFSPSEYDIHGRILSPQGTAIGNEFVISVGLKQNPSVASLTNGNAFVAWEDYQVGSSIYGRVFSPQGTAIINEFVINQNATGGQKNPSVTSLTNGNVFVAWEAYPPSLTYNVYGRIFDPNGTAINNQFALSQDITDNQTHPSAASLTNGNVFVAWEGYVSGRSSIYGRIFYSNGTAISNQFLINQLSTLGRYNPSVASLADGNVFVAWDTNLAASITRPYGKIFYSNGTAMNNEFLLTQATQGSQHNPSVASLADGNVFVVWDGYQTSLSSNIYGRIFSPQGAPIGNEFGINQNSTVDQSSVASLSNGNVFATWGSGQTSNDSIYGRIVSGQGLTPSPIAGPVAPPISAPVVVPAPSSSNKLEPSSLLRIPAKIVMGGIKTIQSGCNYAKSWFSSEAWSEYFDSTEKTVLAYAKSVVDETPSYHSWHGNSSLGKPTPAYAPLNVSYTTGAGFLPYSVVSGAIGQ